MSESEAMRLARPGVLMGLEAITLATQYHAGKLPYDDFIRAMPRTVKPGGRVNLEAVAYAWIALFASNVLRDVLEGTHETPAEYMQRCAERVYTLADEA